MQAHRLFQLTASVAASVCTGGGLAVWLSTIARRDTWRLAPLNQAAVLYQAGVGLLVFVGSIVSLVLAVYEPTFKNDNSRPILALVVGCILVLQTYLSLSTLRSRLISYFAISIGVCKVLVLLQFFVEGISPRSRNILYSLGMAFTSSELLFLCSQYIRLWVSCMHSSNGTCSYEAIRTQCVLRAASVTSAILSVLSTTLTIAAYNEDGYLNLEVDLRRFKGSADIKLCLIESAVLYGPT
ncbi:hypothetical protein AJ80_02315 [Polytolypa hystricis UAMH7299]|uniref:Uncharacterized protein n=1 Tax=Polytolypa hystricis (strain UAMH7299) TaxID=1447883 RepID=A0A2B7YRP2_POLH7|nr:hypothetical protein AJ80_02315 [Polytolypa hystricis UAMH7299]